MLVEIRCLLLLVASKDWSATPNAPTEPKKFETSKSSHRL